VTALVVDECGPMTSLQDAGRIGWRRFGIAGSGAMDPSALATANALVGNAPGTAAIEFVLLGGSLRLEGHSARVAVAGAPCALALEGQAVPHTATVTMRDGQVLTLGPVREGVYAYLALAGGFALEGQLGSLSLHPRAGIGGLQGRALQAGDRLPLAQDRAPDRGHWLLDPVPLDPDAPIRVVLGPQADYFSETGLQTFLSKDYAVSREADRMGYRLTGPKIEHALGYNIVSDGIVPGSVQVPGSGEPIVMMADCQTTGGYPKIATVISSDLRVIAQRRLGSPVRFQAVEIGEAQALARERGRFISTLPERRRPSRHALPPSEELLSLNLAGAAVNAFGRET
jgi:biotin-dependent carboxylase-like uncharacterized protein